MSEKRQKSQDKKSSFEEDKEEKIENNKIGGLKTRVKHV
jgi:hypothetical protein